MDEKKFNWQEALSALKKAFVSSKLTPEQVRDLIAPMFPEYKLDRLLCLVRDDMRPDGIVLPNAALFLAYCRVLDDYRPLENLLPWKMIFFRGTENQGTVFKVMYPGGNLPPIMNDGIFPPMAIGGTVARLGQKEKSELILRLVNRFNQMYPSEKASDSSSALLALDLNTCSGVDLEKLARLNDEEFLFDIVGIVEHIDRETGILHGFTPHSVRERES